MRVLLTVGAETVERGVEGGMWSEYGSDPVLDLSQYVALPGLADGHAHLAHPAGGDDLSPGDPDRVAERAAEAVRSGVHLVFDKGSCDDVVITTLLGRPAAERPHLQAAGRMIAGRSGYFPGFAHEVDDSELAGAVRAAASTSAGWVKIVADWPQKGIGPAPNFSEDALRTAVTIAHEVGVRVAVHTMAPDVASMTVRAGVDSVEHGLYLTDDDVRMLGDRGGTWVPTVLRMEEVVAQFGLERTAGRVVAEGLDRVRALLPTARAAGVRILAGTDLALPTARVAEEAIRLVDYGLTPADAVRAVSADAWAAASLDPGFEPGTTADLVVFERDPVTDITVLRHPVVVIRAGRVVADNR